VILLRVCFESYRNIKHGKEFRDIPIYKTEFVVYRKGIVEHALGDLGAYVVKGLVVTKETVKLGGTLRTNSGYCAPRVLEKEVWLQFGCPTELTFVSRYV
jgi:hypothetical protein